MTGGNRVLGSTPGRTRSQGAHPRQEAPFTERRLGGRLGVGGRGERARPAARRDERQDHCSTRPCQAPQHSRSSPTGLSGSWSIPVKSPDLAPRPPHAGADGLGLAAGRLPIRPGGRRRKCPLERPITSPAIVWRIDCAGSASGTASPAIEHTTRSRSPQGKAPCGSASSSRVQIQVARLNLDYSGCDLPADLVEGAAQTGLSTKGLILPSPTPPFASRRYCPLGRERALHEPANRSKTGFVPVDDGAREDVLAEVGLVDVDTYAPRTFSSVAAWSAPRPQAPATLKTTPDPRQSD